MRRFFLVSLSAVLLLALLKTVVFAAGAPDLTVRVAYDDEQEQNTGVPGAVVVITADNGSVVKTATTDDNGLAILKKMRIKPGRQIRIGIQGLLPDGIKIYQKGSDKKGMLVDYLTGLQQNFIVARDGQAWPDHKQWDQGLTDEADPGAYTDRAAASDNKSLPDSAPYMGKTRKIPRKPAPDNATTATSRREKQRAPANGYRRESFLSVPVRLPGAEAPPLVAPTSIMPTRQQPVPTTVLPAAPSAQSAREDESWVYGMLVFFGVLAIAGFVYKKTRG